LNGLESVDWVAELFPASGCTVTDAVVTEVTAWQSRPLEPLYPVVFFNALRVRFATRPPGLEGMSEALAAVFPATTLQTCIVHLLRHSLDYANRK
jgi:putative transposase